jgi:AcrR family transcriptional regulator
LIESRKLVARKPADQTVQRADVLKAAAAAFQERGYHGTTMIDIAERVHLTAGSLYHHFSGGKPDLLAAVLNEGLDIVLTQVDAIMAQPLSPTEMLRRMIAAHIVAVTENISTGAAMVFESRTILEIPQVREPFLRRRDAFERCYRTVIERGIAEGEFEPVDVGVFTKVLLGAHNWVGVWFRPAGRLSGLEIADRLTDIWLSVLKPNQKLETAVTPAPLAH